MQSAVERVFAMVREKTGYPVSVTPIAGIETHAKLKMATAGTPVHTILLNPAYERTANYLAAVQAAMILAQWARGRVPEFAADERHLASVVLEMGRDKRLCGLDKAVAAEAARMVVNGLARQLASFPVQILAADWCYANCPELHEEQRLHVRRELRELSACLAPDVRDNTPEFVFERNAAMNAACAVWWSFLSEETQAVLPYELLGFKDRGMTLYDRLRAVPAADPDRCRKAVDGWAEELGLRDWYVWQFR